jgi:transposase
VAGNPRRNSLFAVGHPICGFAKTGWWAHQGSNLGPDGHLFLFRGRKANLIKIVFWDGTGFCLFTKRLEQGRFHWPVTCEMGGTVMLSSSQLSMLIEGIDWRAPERKWRPAVAG